MSWVKSTYGSVRGQIEADYHIRSDSIDLKVLVPPNTVAIVTVPTRDPASVTELGQHIAEVTGITLKRKTVNSAIYEVQSGSYHFQALAPINN